jgi:hypothetical protein
LLADSTNTRADGKRGERYMDDAQARKPTDDDLKALGDTIRRANEGDREAVAALREFLDRNEHVWRRIGDLALMAERAWIALIAAGNAIAAQAIERQLIEIRDGLVGRQSSPAIRMLADQVVATLLETRYIESVAATAKLNTLLQETQLLKRLESAQRRHLAAIKTLEQTRKMLSENSVAPYLRVIGARATA